MCASWAELDKERKRLALGQERLDLDVQLFKAEKRNTRRMAFLQAEQQLQQEQQQLAQQEVQEQLAQQRAQQLEQEQQSVIAKEAAEQHEQELQRKWEKTVKQLKGQYETEIEQWKLKYLKEQEDRKIQVLEWKLKFQTQDADIQQGQQDVLEHQRELQQLQKQYRDLQQQQQREQELSQQQKALEQEREADRAKHLEVQRQLQDQHKINADQLELVARQKDELNTLRDQVMRMNSLLEGSSSNQARSQEDVNELHDKLEDAMIENERYAKHIQELNNKYKILEEQRGSVAQGHGQNLSDDEDDDDVYVDEAKGKRDCPKCEGLEEEVFLLKCELNKLQISSQKEIEGLEERLQKKMTMAATTPVGDDHVVEKMGRAGISAVWTATERNTGKIGKELHSVRKLETEMKKVDMKTLAFAAKDELSKREKRALEQELEDAKREIQYLGLELEQLHNERELEREEAGVPRLDQEQLVDLMRQIDHLQQSQDAYVVRHKVNAQEWNGLAESLSKKQRQVFDSILPQLDDKMQELEQHINELEKVESSGTPSANAMDNSVLQISRRRKPPLTKIDSNNNRHVSEFHYESEDIPGKYTGFLNAFNQPEGHGVLLVKNQDVYEGEWKNGKLHGQGVRVSYDGDLYVGPWFEGKRHGHGVSVFADGQLYVGGYNMDHFEGQAITVWPHGNKYEGSYANHMRNGFGEFLYPDGRVYRGEYVDDKRHGYGVELSRDGKVLYAGLWAFGAFEGEGGDSGSVVASIADPRER